jgi:hypothetical protein
VTETVHEEMLRRAAELLRTSAINAPPIEVEEWLHEHNLYIAGAPEGFEFAWLPETDSRWVVLDTPSDYACRGRRFCTARTIVKINRGVTGDRPRYFHYCEKHMYGRRLVNGRLEARRLRPKGAAA